jgi:hypothetical protein
MVVGNCTSLYAKRQIYIYIYIFWPLRRMKRHPVMLDIVAVSRVCGKCPECEVARFRYYQTAKVQVREAS